MSDLFSGKETDYELQGYKLFGTSEPETTGIRMWSDIFTHDFKNGNGDKVAIFVFDTQGNFDKKDKKKYCTTILTISMMISSMQCYNVMQNKNVMQNFKLFTDYDKLATVLPIEKPYLKLLFVIGDWSCSELTPRMKKLRGRILRSSSSIYPLWMPHPGSILAGGGLVNRQHINPKFVEYVKELFAPKNLIVKTINGQKLLARDLLAYLESYVKIFQESVHALPEPKTLLEVCWILVIRNRFWS